MGYWASGSGSITFAEQLPENIIKEIQNIMSDDFDTEAYTQNNVTIIDVTADGKYHGDDIAAVLDEIANKATIAYGEIEFAGEDSCHWRFIWENDRWDEQNGEIVYKTGYRFGEVIWTEDDVRNYLDEHPEFPDDPEFVSQVIVNCENDHHFTDTMIEAGWEQIAYHAYETLTAWNRKEH